ncbi:hypothetical protein V8E52_003530 [Russula decolorans]
MRFSGAPRNFRNAFRDFPSEIRKTKQHLPQAVISFDSSLVRRRQRTSMAPPGWSRKHVVNPTLIPSRRRLRPHFLEKLDAEAIAGFRIERGRGSTRAAITATRDLSGNPFRPAAVEYREALNVFGAPTRYHLTPVFRRGNQFRISERHGEHLSGPHATLPLALHYKSYREHRCSAWPGQILLCIVADRSGNRSVGWKTGGTSVANVAEVMQPPSVRSGQKHLSHHSVSPAELPTLFAQKSRCLDDVGNNCFGTHDQASGSKTARSEVLFLSTHIPPFLIWATCTPFLRCEVLCVKIRRSPMR